MTHDSLRAKFPHDGLCLLMIKIYYDREWNVPRHCLLAVLRQLHFPVTRGNDVRKYVRYIS